ncbi:uncharacterized protein LOC107224717 [Neodiprion lecontei]|uniref:Uncharacterized protein LOC107224717 n=1 Tax=Neodiprion lecontei TaxID=441921 RepID=A0A6J0C1R2_NEOLC|nr:uncharacterized protein LOC107224717 [Neodiprion lecontei]
MASSFGVKIDNLRSRSRVLLTCLEENAKIVRKEVKKLRSQDSYRLHGTSKRRSAYGRQSDIWKLRNDSSGVGALLCPDYFRPSSKYESVSATDMSANRRLPVVKPERKQPKSSSPRRSVVKECYCQTAMLQTRKANQRSMRTRHAPICLPSFRETDDAVHGDAGSPRDPPELAYSPPLSTTTLRRAQKIDYTPRSEFLRRVQSKINTLRDSQLGTPRAPSPLPRRFNSTSGNVPGNSKSLEERRNGGVELPRKHNCRRGVDIEALPKKTSLPKKTIASRKLMNDQNKPANFRSRERRAAFRSSSPDGRTLRMVSGDGNFSRPSVGDERKSCPCSEYRADKFLGEQGENEAVDSEVNDVRKFRDKNYFDTHASCPSLLGSRSSGSLQQFRLNERLFPEPVGRVHRDDLVVSIPPCATRQRRGVHYFPRSIVRQEKNASNTNYTKKRRCPAGCPLIGHAVDLGALKVSHPSNSLALRFQKGIR